MNPLGARLCNSVWVIRIHLRLYLLFDRRLEFWRLVDDRDAIFIDRLLACLFIHRNDLEMVSYRFTTKKFGWLICAGGSIIGVAVVKEGVVDMHLDFVEWDNRLYRATRATFLKLENAKHFEML